MTACAALRTLLLAGVASLAACAQQPAKPSASLHSEAIAANHKAGLRFRSGDFDGAVRQYREALRIAQSIEDVEGIAANAINISIAQQRLGNHAEARASLAPVLDQSLLRFPPQRLAQAALRRAVLDFDERRYAGAAAWLEKATGWCAQPGCTLASAIHNMNGMLALETGRSDLAAASARAALALSRAAGNRVEAANALRLLGSVAIHTGDATTALVALHEALVIDLELALPRKIYLDLVELGRASALGGDPAAARDFYARALAVSDADRDSQGAVAVRGVLRARDGKP